LSGRHSVLSPELVLLLLLLELLSILLEALLSSLLSPMVIIGTGMMTGLILFR
jgi:hypothetical protein